MFINLQVHEPSYNNHVDNAESYEAFELINHQTVNKGGENHSKSTITADENAVMDSLGEHVQVKESYK